jgi:PAS domain S-box-containing protein
MFWSKKNHKEPEKLLYENDVTISRYLLDGILVFNSENRLFLINPAAERFLQVKEDEVIGKSILELSGFPRISPIGSLVGGGLEECFRQELSFNSDLVLEITSIHMRVEGERVSTLIILHDVTREKLAERMKAEFVTLAAHQLRTPISGVKWSLRALLDEDMGKISKKQRDILEQAYKTNNKVVNLISDLLNVAEIEEGRYLKKLSLWSIEDIISSVIGDFEEQFKKKGIKVRLLKPEGDMPKVMVDVEKLKLAFGNIINNAIKYTFGGGKIKVSLAKHEKYIEVQVEDTGIGIPLSQQNKVFNKFFRSSNVMKIDTEGTGLGLYIAKNIIEAHNGRIWFESEENKGTTFHFTIPIKKRYGEFLTEEFY